MEWSRRRHNTDRGEEREIDMKSITVQEVRSITAARPLTRIPEQAAITSVTTSSKEVPKGSLFVALRGEKHDGHAYLGDAAAKGAVAALVEQPVGGVADPARPHAGSATPPTGNPLVLLQVPNTRVAMGKLARHVRRQFRGTVIAVGGSNGKTGTKCLIDSALRLRKRGSASIKSFNNDVGVPTTIFNADPAHDYLVLELGTNHPGEISNLTSIAEPDIAVITNVSAEHLEGLGDLAGVRREEAALIEGLNPEGMLVVNGDDPALLDAVARYPGKRLTFGFADTNDLFPTDIRCEFDGTRFKLNGRQEYFIPMIGRHVAVNALAAIAVARRMLLSEAQVADALARATGPEMRLQLLRGSRLTLLNDAYNANPASVGAALETLGLLKASRHVAVLGDMRELGAATETSHREIGQLAGRSGLDLLICVGPQAALIAEEAVGAGMPASRVQHYADVPTAAAALPGQLQDGDLVLLKASRYVALERLIEAICPELVTQRKAS